MSAGLTVPVPVPVPVLTTLYTSGVIGFSRADKPDGASSGAKKKAYASNRPCEFAGSWTSARAASGYKVTLGENGQYVAKPIGSGAYSGATLRGTWRIDGRQMSGNSASRSASPAGTNELPEVKTKNLCAARGPWRDHVLQPDVGISDSTLSTALATGPASARQRLIHPHKTATTTGC